MLEVAADRIPAVYPGLGVGEQREAGAKTSWLDSRVKNGVRPECR